MDSTTTRQGRKMKMVYDEWYGELSYSQRAAYRKHNISPADHDDLCREFGEHSHVAITAAVKERKGARP
jgi:hypothetical protein